MPDGFEAVWGAVIVLILGAIAAATPAVKSLITAWFKRFENKLVQSSTRIAYRNGIERLAEFHGVLEQLRDLEYVDRTMVLVGKNGGGTPQPGKIYTVEAIHGWSNREGHHPEREYNYRMRVDAFYMEMLLKVIKDGIVINKTADMPPKALLTSLYKNEGVFESLVFPVNLTDSELIFLSVASYTRSFSELELSKILLLLNRMRSIFTTTVVTPESTE